MTKSPNKIHHKDTNDTKIQHGLADYLWGFSFILAGWAKERPTKAADFLPSAEGECPGDGEVLISETLRWATGQDLGLDWTKWRKYLAHRQD